MDQTDFNQILIESVHEAIAVVLGRHLTEELVQHLQSYLGISNDEMPTHIAELFASLRGSFGLVGDDLSKLIVKKMYIKAGIPFYEIGGTPDPICSRSQEKTRNEIVCL